jgi:hypothetical protein
MTIVHIYELVRVSETRSNRGDHESRDRDANTFERKERSTQQGGAIADDPG